MIEESTVRRSGAWQGHRALARVLRVLLVVVPVGVGVATSYALATIIPAPTSTAARWTEIVGFAVAGVLAMRIATELAQKLLPLSTLLGLTLVFPDATPSRMRVAMRVTSEARLYELIADTRANGLPSDPSQAAERILELVAALSYHDRLTRGHSERVRAFSGLITAEMGLDDDEVEHLQWAGLLHDVGKIAVPSEILNKPGKLTDDEFEVIKRHPAYGERMLEPLRSWLGDAVDAAGQHHERWDGRGYPRGIDGETIALSARIVAVADVFDVITSTRSYKDASSTADARGEIARCAGTQFDEHVVRAFLAIPLARLRRAMGPLTVLAQLPILGSISTAAGTAINAVAAAGTVGAMTVASIAAAPPLANTSPGPSAEVLGETFEAPASSTTSSGTTANTTNDGTTVSTTDDGSATTPFPASLDSTTTIPGVDTTLPLTTTTTVTVPGTLPTTTTSITVPETLPATTTSITVPITLPTTTTTTITVPITLPTTSTTITVPTLLP
jgi:HD-GYP domain-containing protein (c-di-GMP phosphodiesterase class II)